MSFEILCGDARELLDTIEAETIQCMVSSPPYFQAREYGTATWEGGDPDCDHRIYLGGNGVASAKQLTSTGTQGYLARDNCPKCGAIRRDKQIGQESTPDDYVAALVGVMRKVWRALRPDGVAWLNLGDGYVSTGGHSAQGESSARVGRANVDIQNEQKGFRPGVRVDGIKTKDLIGIPWMVAFALRADGWYLRRDIIWDKPNAMVESTKDRPTTSHEYIFLLTKSATYYYDGEAIKEQAATPAGVRGAKGSALRASQEGVNSRPPEYVVYDGARNARSVWRIATSSGQGPATEHYATFPQALPERCILAGTRLGDTVLDPFSGTGTTGAAALRLGRNYVGIELHPGHAKTSIKRLTAIAAQPSLLDIPRAQPTQEPAQDAFL